MKLSPVQAVEPSGPGGRKKTTNARMVAKRKSIGIPILASFSIPPEMPFERIQILMTSVTTKKKYGLHAAWTRTAGSPTP